MKRLVLCLAFLLPMLAIAPSRRAFLGDNQGFAAGGGGASFSDDFGRGDSDSIGAVWTEAAGNASILTNTLSMLTTGYGEIVCAYTGTACNTVNQYVKVTWRNGASGAGRYPGITLRYTDASSPMYVIYFFVNENQIDWGRKANAADGSFTVVQSITSITVDEGDTWGVTITGTGTSTVIRCWKNPTGNAPTSATDWGGDTTPEASFTSDPASPVNTGSYVGVGAEVSGASDVNMDDFYGGDIP